MLELHSIEEALEIVRAANRFDWSVCTRSNCLLCTRPVAFPLHSSFSSTPPLTTHPPLFISDSLQKNPWVSFSVGRTEEPSKKCCWVRKIGGASGLGRLHTLTQILSTFVFRTLATQAIVGEKDKDINEMDEHKDIEEDMRAVLDRELSNSREGEEELSSFFQLLQIDRGEEREGRPIHSLIAPHLTSIEEEPRPMLQGIGGGGEEEAEGKGKDKSQKQKQRKTKIKNENRSWRKPMNSGHAALARFMWLFGQGERVPTLTARASMAKSFHPIKNTEAGQTCAYSEKLLKRKRLIKIPIKGCTG